MSKECYYCGFRDPMPFTCKYCGYSYCYNHRLPESHNCPGLALLKERARNSGKIYSRGPDFTVRRRRRPIFNSLNNAVNVIKSNYSLSILIIAIISFFLQYVFGEPYYSNLALFPPDIFSNPLKFAINLVTSMFLHANIIHLLFNMMFLFFFGPELERRIGGNRFLAVFLISGIVAGLGYTVWSILIRSPGPVVGASGALFGIFACLAVIAPNIQVYLYFIPMKITHLLILYALFDLFFLGYGDTIARSAHLSGVLAGLIIGRQMKKKGQYIRY